MTRVKAISVGKPENRPEKLKLQWQRENSLSKIHEG